MGFQEVGEAYLLTREKADSREPWPTALDMTLAFSKIMSLAEGQPLTHGLEVAVLAGTLGSSLLGTAKEWQNLMLAALVHDMGIFALMGRLSSEQEGLLAEHISRIQANDWADIPGLERHLLFPTEVMRLLHLDGEIVRLVAYHHTFLDMTGLPPDVPILAPPDMAANLLTFCDSLLFEAGRSPNPAVRYDRVMAYLGTIPSGRFYPEIGTTFRELFDTPEAMRHLDHRTLTPRFLALYPQPAASPVLNGTEILNLGRWLGNQVDARQPAYTSGEAALTAELMVKLGMALELPLDALGQLALAGLLHDVGKIAISLEVLNSERNFNSSDRETLALHTRLMEDIFSEIPGFETLGIWLGAHHECLNGSGYPYGKRRHEIPVGARLLAIADTYVALTHPRPFRPMPYRPQDALDIMKTQQGRIFDPSLLGLLETSLWPARAEDA